MPCELTHFLALGLAFLSLVSTLSFVVKFFYKHFHLSSVRLRKEEFSAFRVAQGGILDDSRDTRAVVGLF